MGQQVGAPASPAPAQVSSCYLEGQESSRSVEGAHFLLFIIQAPLWEPVLVLLKALRPTAPSQMDATSASPPLLFTTAPSVPASQFKLKLAPPLAMFPPASRARATI